MFSFTFDIIYDIDEAAIPLLTNLNNFEYCVFRYLNKFIS